MSEEDKEKKPNKIHVSTVLRSHSYTYCPLGEKGGRKYTMYDRELHRLIQFSQVPNHINNTTENLHGMG